MFLFSVFFVFQIHSLNKCQWSAFHVPGPAEGTEHSRYLKHQNLNHSYFQENHSKYFKYFCAFHEQNIPRHSLCKICMKTIKREKINSLGETQLQNGIKRTSLLKICLFKRKGEYSGEKIKEGQNRNEKHSGSFCELLMVGN